MTQDSKLDSIARNPAEEDEISLLDLALVLAENIRILILVPLAAGLLALGNGYLTIPTFTATTRILPPSQAQSASAAVASQLGALVGLAGLGGASKGDQYVSFLKSTPVMDAMIERFKLKELWKAEFQEDARNGLAGHTKISVGLKDGIISIEVVDPDPKRAADMANAYVEELRNLMKTLAVTEPAQRRIFFDSQVKQAKDNLTRSEIALRGSGISEAALRTVPQSTLDALSRIKVQITAQEIRLASMRTSMTDSNPDFRVALGELAALRAELLKAEQSKTSKANGDGPEYIAKVREFKYHEALFELMAKQYELARLDEAREGSIVQVLDAAEPPVRKSGPKKAQNAVLTTLAFFLIMVLFVFTRHALRHMAQEGESAEKIRRIRHLLRLRRT